MKTMRMIQWLLVISIIFVFSGVALSGGKPEDPACTEIPEPTSGPHIWGTFTVARSKDPCVEYPQCRHYDVHLVLWRGNAVHLFSFPTSLGAGDLCAAAEDTESLKALFERTPCTLGVGQAFGLEGVPAIQDLSVTETDFCGTETEDEMIQGSVTIRVVRTH